MSVITETEHARAEQLDNPESIYRACADMKLFNQEVLRVVSWTRATATSRPWKSPKEASTRKAHRWVMHYRKGSAQISSGDINKPGGRCRRNDGFCIIAFATLTAAPERQKRPSKDSHPQENYVYLPMS
jgi:hypothetical protein